MGKVVKPLLCHMTGGNQYWMFRTDGKILRDFLCIGRQVTHNYISIFWLLKLEGSDKRNINTNNIL